MVSAQGSGIYAKEEALNKKLKFEGMLKEEQFVHNERRRIRRREQNPSRRSGSISCHGPWPFFSFYRN
jgi:hypothetical protein